MIRAGKVACIAAFLAADQRAAVAAGVHVYINLVVITATDDDRDTAYRRGAKVARLFDLALVCDITPAVFEQVMHLRSEDCRVGIDAAMHGKVGRRLPDEVGVVSAMCRHTL